jgi:hypothetical protein
MSTRWCRKFTIVGWENEAIRSDAAAQALHSLILWALMGIIEKESDE